MDTIKLTRMAFFGYHGDEPEETKLGQRFYIDVELHLDLSKVGETDCLEDSVNYVAVYQMVKERAEGGPYKLTWVQSGEFAGHSEAGGCNARGDRGTSYREEVCHL